MGESKRDYERRKATIKRVKAVKRVLKLVLLYIIMVAFCVTGIWLTVVLYDHYKGKPSGGASLPPQSSQNNEAQTEAVAKLQNVTLPTDVSAKIIDIGLARTGAKLSDFKGIVVHCVGIPGATADERHDYYAATDSSVSSHFVVGLDGKTIMCVPLDEQANITGARNADTISIEYCHTTVDGLMSVDTYNVLVDLCAAILKGADLNTDSLLRHYDATEAQCPPYYVSHEDKWEKFKSDVADRMAE